MATLVLIGIGGLVTSHEAGLSVPDWPTSYGYNMFLFPISKWVGGILYEHTHRLVATIVGVLVVCLTRWLGGREACKPLIIIGLLELLAGFGMLQFAPKLSGAGYFLSGSRRNGVVGGLRLGADMAQRLQLYKAWLACVCARADTRLPEGGLRVVWFRDQIGIFHAALAQIVFVLTLCAIACFSARRAGGANLLLVTRKPQPDRAGSASSDCCCATLLIFGQLLLGATMRHQHAGLAIPDFPLAYHKLWPPLGITNSGFDRLLQFADPR